MAIKPLLRLARAPSLLLRRSWLRLRLGRFGNDALVEAGARLQYPDRIRLGNGVRIASQAMLRANTDHPTGISIGDNVLIAAHTSINTVSHHFERCDIPINDQGIYCDPVTIEDDAWIGINAVILQGVTIGQGAIVGAGAVVTRDVPPWSIVMGVPARVISQRSNAAVTEDATHA